MEGAPRSAICRLHSVSGLVPVGAFLAFHIYVNSYASRGADAYNELAGRLQRMPLVAAFELALIVLPLCFHGIYGLFLTAAEPPALQLSRAGRGLVVFQRATGVFLFAFVLFHLWTTRLVQLRDHESLDLFRLMQATLASAWIRALYVAGIVAAAAHLSAGMWSFFRDSGLPRSRRSLHTAAIVAAVVFALLSAAGLRSLAAFRL